MEEHREAVQRMQDYIYKGIYKGTFRCLSLLIF